MKQLTTLVPEWLSVKDSQRGKVVRLNTASLPGAELQATIQQRIHNQKIDKMKWFEIYYNNNYLQ